MGGERGSPGLRDMELQGPPEDVEILQEGNEGSIQGSHPLVQLHQETAHKEGGDRHRDRAVDVILHAGAIYGSCTSHGSSLDSQSSQQEQKRREMIRRATAAKGLVRFGAQRHKEDC